MRIETRRENKTETTLISRIGNMSTCEKCLYCSERIIEQGKGLQSRNGTRQVEQGLEIKYNESRNKRKDESELDLGYC
jgi:hypothetical protein